jgi:hypothetical protein
MILSVVKWSAKCQSMKGLILSEKEQLRWRVFEMRWLRQGVEGLRGNNSARGCSDRAGQPFLLLSGGMEAMDAYGTLN